MTKRTKTMKKMKEQPKKTGVNPRKLKQKSIKEQREVKENHPAQRLWLLNNKHFCYGGESPINNDNEIKQHFLQHKKHKNTKEAYTDRSKSTGRKVGFATVFTDFTRRGILPEEVFIHQQK